MPRSGRESVLMSGRVAPKTLEAFEKLAKELGFMYSQKPQPMAVLDSITKHPTALQVLKTLLENKNPKQSVDTFTECD